MFTVTLFSWRTFVSPVTPLIAPYAIPGIMHCYAISTWKPFDREHLLLCRNVATCRRTAAGAVATDDLARGCYPCQFENIASSILSLCHR